MEQYLLLALIIIGFWVVGFIIYLVLSNRQRDIEAEIRHINTMLDTNDSSIVAE